MNKENLDFFKDEERKSGKVLDFIEDAAVIEDENGKQFVAENFSIELNKNDTVSFIAVDGTADDLLVV